MCAGTLRVPAFFLYTKDHMRDLSDLETLQHILFNASGVILYTPQKGEVDFSHESFPFSLPTDHIVIPSDKHSDPYAMAETCRARYPHHAVCLLIPGSHFDSTGTRHGRGGGWYDRFLSKLPQQWTRIGLLENERLSDIPLVRKAWDEPLDWLVIHDASKDSWHIVETRARHPLT